MTLALDVELDPDELREVHGTDPRSWFTHVRFGNGESPRHPGYESLEPNHRMKRDLVVPWLARVVPGAKVLDTFSANGAFAFEAMALGAKSVTGVEFDPGRVGTAQLVATYLERHGWASVPRFEVGDVYELERYGSEFDVSLCLGGLYHIPDPVLLLQKLRKVTAKGGYLVLQTSGILRLPGAWARFWWVKDDRAESGFSSLRGGSGRWMFTTKHVDHMLGFAGFEILERRRPPMSKRRRFPWYCALARAV
jgi:tRNA (mo5U34)-methyltransferase